MLLSKQEATSQGQCHLITSVKISKNSKALTEHFVSDWKESGGFPSSV